MAVGGRIWQDGNIIYSEFLLVSVKNKNNEPYRTIKNRRFA
jgi:hypothetical protein